jgi:predicted ATPase
MTKTGEKFWHAELHRIKGQLLLESSGDNHVEAESNFHKAIEISRTQNTRGWELRAATNLARLWLDQNKAAEARQLLAPIYNWFTEGFEATDLREAKALLDRL